MPQVTDCLERGWIVLVPNHRLCPGVNLLEGPMQDIRDLLSWAHGGHLDAVLQKRGYSADLDNMAAFGTSSGGTLALGLVCDPYGWMALREWNLIQMKTGLRRSQPAQGDPLALRRCSLHAPVLENASPARGGQITTSRRLVLDEGLRGDSRSDR